MKYTGITFRILILRSCHLLLSPINIYNIPSTIPPPPTSSIKSRQVLCTGFFFVTVHGLCLYWIRQETIKGRRQLSTWYCVPTNCLRYSTLLGKIELVSFHEEPKLEYLCLKQRSLFYNASFLLSVSYLFSLFFCLPFPYILYTRPLSLRSQSTEILWTYLQILGKVLWTRERLWTTSKKINGK